MNKGNFIPSNLRWLRLSKDWTQEKFSEEIGIKKADLSNWETGRNLPRPEKLDRIVAYFSITLDDLFKVDLSKKVSADSKQLVKEVPITITQQELGVPVYDVEFSAGVAASILEARDVAPVVAYLNLPEVSGCEAIIRARGDSMSDFINDRDWIGIKQVTDWDVLLWDYPYAVVTDDLEVIKYVKKGTSKKNIILKSHNDRYSDVELPIEKIQKLFLVKVVLPFSQVKTII